MIIFFPIEDSTWNKTFSFKRSITLECKHDLDWHATFRDRAELIEFLKQHDVKLNDGLNPLKFEQAPPGTEDPHPYYSGTIYNVIQGSLVGQMKDDHR